MTTAQRNRAIKTLLEKHYGKGRVWVRGSRGTAYGWVHVYISISTRLIMSRANIALMKAARFTN